MNLSTTGRILWRCLWRHLMLIVFPALLLALGACGTQAQMDSPKIYTQIAAGDAHACALANDGTVMCWGRNSEGQLGNGAIYDGSGNSLSSLISANLRAATGQPGNGSSIPVTVPGLSGVVAISAGGNQSCALLGDGSVKCWGSTSHLLDVSSVPVAVTGLMGAVTAISVGAGHVCALLGSGGVQCWGGAASGQLGNGATTYSKTPVAVTGLTSVVTAISAGNRRTCALLNGGTIQCWGAASSTTPVTMTGLKGATAISVGGWNTCVLLSGGAVQCWDGSGSTPVIVAGLTGVRAISVGRGHTCAVLGDGTAKCWGDGGYGQLGNGASNDSKIPVTVTGLTGATAISAGEYFSCALRNDGSIWCWGSNRQGELGDGSFPTDRSTAARIRS